MKTRPTRPELSPAAQRVLVDERIRQDFVSFIRKSFETVVPGELLHLNWHIRAIAHALDEVRRGKIKRLIINVPPRHLKSITTSVAFPSFLLGHDPTKKIVCVSYSSELAVKHALDCRAVIQSDWYRRLFPKTRISPDKNTELETLTTMRGGRFATSVGGTLTGRGGNLIILDDPINPKQAMSEASRTMVTRWYQTTLLSRLNLKGEDAIVVVMQRLHVDDLVGVLLDEGGWHHLNIPAIAEMPQQVPLGMGQFKRRKINDVLDPLREPREVLVGLKASMGTMDFSAQYQQQPIPAEGNLIKREWLKFYQTVPKRQLTDIIIISWDTAMKASELADYSVGTIWLVQHANTYLLDVVRGRYDYPNLKRAAIGTQVKWPGSHVLIEDKGSGTSLIQDLRSQNIPVIAIQPAGDKETRLFTNQAQFESGSVHFPQRALWLDDLIAELLAFPQVRHDDQVDSIAQALTWIEQKRRSLNATFVSPIIVKIRSPYSHLYGD
jgi:predicted phage terminase large subunit-like protein